MDDRILAKVWDYGMCELVPRFQREYNEYGTMSKCQSYEEIKDYCNVEAYGVVIGGGVLRE